MFPDRNAAADDRERRFLIPRLIASLNDSRRHDNAPRNLRSAPQRFSRATEQHRVAVVNLPRLKFFTRLHQLVTGRNDCRVHFAADSHFGKTLRRQ